MHDFVFRLVVIHSLFCMGRGYWRDVKEVWNCDLDAYWCCDSVDHYGVMDCGCCAISNRDYWSGYIE